MFTAIIYSNTFSATPSFFSPTGNTKTQMLDLVALSHRSLRFWYYLLFQSFFSMVLEIDSSLISTLLSRAFFFYFCYCVFQVYNSHSVLLFMFYYFSEIFYPSMYFKIAYCYFLEHFNSSSFQLCLIIPVISVILALASIDCLFIYKLICFWFFVCRVILECILNMWN